MEYTKDKKKLAENTKYIHYDIYTLYINQKKG